MSTLLDKYGEYVIESGTLLFRRAANKAFHESMFFGFCRIGPSTSNVRSDAVQVWKTTKAIRSLLMLRGQQKTDGKPLLYSAIVDIYNEYFPLDKKHEYDDVTLKKKDTICRRRVINLMRNQGISSWVSSVEDNLAMEFFVFAGVADHSQLFSYVESYKTFPGYAHKDYANSFNYKKICHLPEIRKGPPPDDPFIDWIITGNPNRLMDDQPKG